jgi:hypothetical protein
MLYNAVNSFSRIVYIKRMPPMPFSFDKTTTQKSEFVSVLNFPQFCTNLGWRLKLMKTICCRFPVSKVRSLTMKNRTNIHEPRYRVRSERKLGEVRLVCLTSGKKALALVSMRTVLSGLWFQREPRVAERANIKRKSITNRALLWSSDAANLFVVALF